MNELQNQKGSRPLSQKAFELAECRFKKSLEVSESRGNEHGAASSYAELGVLAGMQRRYDASARWSLRAIKGFRHTNDDAGVREGIRNFISAYRLATPPGSGAIDGHMGGIRTGAISANGHVSRPRCEQGGEQGGEAERQEGGAHAQAQRRPAGTSHDVYPSRSAP